MPKKMTISCQCCFCHDGIPAADAMAVLLILNWGTPGPNADKPSQQFFAHPKCFERATDETIEAT
jgi:hypothetical protein